MYNNGDNQTMQNGQNASYTAYEEANSNYPRGGATSADSLEQELFYGNGSRGATMGAYQQQPSHAATMYAEPQTEDYSARYSKLDPDQRPTDVTMQFMGSKNPYEDYHEEGEEIADRRYKISTKGKVIAAVYAIVIATILALIILNTRLLKNMDSQIAYQQTEINALVKQQQQLGNEFDYVRSDAVIEQKASELGMVPGEN